MIWSDAELLLMEYILLEEVDHKTFRLIPAMELKSHVIYIKDVEEGTGISYGSTFVTKKRTKVATIPVGYADGYSRNLSNVGKVIITGSVCTNYRKNLHGLFYGRCN